MDWFLLYLILKLDAIRDMFIGGMIVTVVFAFFFILMGTVPDHSENGKQYLKSGRKSIHAAIVLAVFAVLTPTTKQVIVITGGVGVLEAARTDRANEIASKSVLVIEKFLDNYLKETEKPTK